MSDEQSELTEEDIPDMDLPQYIFYIIVWARVLYSGAVSLGTLYVVAYFTQLPFMPYTAIQTGDGFTLGVWTAVLALIVFVVMATGFKLWVVLSWLTAVPFSAELRNKFKDIW